MSVQGEEARRWLRYAAEDLVTAERIAASRTMPPRNACYHSQQAAEKAIKAALVFLQIPFPFRHDLDFLRDLLPAGWSVKIYHPDLAPLTAWVAEARYPTELPDADKADARAAIRQARAVYQTVHTDLFAHGLSVTE
jgi:HEPN domain-containing protein